MFLVRVKVTVISASTVGITVVMLNCGFTLRSAGWVRNGRDTGGDLTVPWTSLVYFTAGMETRGSLDVG